MVGCYQFAEAHQEWYGVGEQRADVGLDVGEGIRGGDARRAQCIGRELIAAAHRDDADPCRPRGGRDAGGGLTVQGLLVEGAFARHH